MLEQTLYMILNLRIGEQTQNLKDPTVTYLMIQMHSIISQKLLSTCSVIQRMNYSYFINIILL
jgi:hypothetical protein